MDEYYSKGEIERFINWLDSIRKEWQDQKYLNPVTLEKIGFVEKNIGIQNNLIWKWQRRLEQGRGILK